MPEMSKSPVKALVERIWTVADLYPTREATAQSAGVSNPQLNRYVNGRAKISLIIVLRLAEPQGILMNRLAAGNGAIYANVETPNQEQTIRLIRHFSNQVDEILAADGLSIKLRQRQDLMRTIYDMDSKR